MQPGKNGADACLMAHSECSASYSIATPPFRHRVNAITTKIRQIQKIGSFDIAERTRVRASWSISPTRREGSRNIHTAERKESHKIAFALQASPQKGKRNSGATASKARCAASPYFDIAFCTLVRQAQTNRTAEAVIFVATLIAEPLLVLNPSIDLEEAVERVVQAETGGKDIVINVISA